MRRIHALGNQLSFHKFHYPIRVFKKDLMDLDLDVRFFTNPLASGIEDCETLLFYDDHYRDLIPIDKKDRSSATDFLKVYLKKFQRVVWFDGTDGSGWLRNYIFPYIDVYAKGHLMQDLGYYQEDHPTGLMHRDFVFENYQAADPCKFKGPITNADRNKLKVAWNAAFKNWRWKNLPGYDRILDIFHKNQYHFQFTAPNLSKRSFLIPYRVSYWDNIPTVKWWREQTRKNLETAIFHNPPYYLNPPGRVGRKQYIQELQKSVVTVSPFGIGEYAYRDFECFVCGSILFKPDMRHQRTWPDFYVEDETYISHRWDFNDFNEKLGDILAHPKRYEEIAFEGQRWFCTAITDGEAFARQFQELISPVHVQ